MPRSVPIVLLNTSLQGCVDPADSKMEKIRKTTPIPRISQTRGNRSRTLTTEIITIEIRRTYNCRIASELSYLVLIYAMDLPLAVSTSSL